MNAFVLSLMIVAIRLPASTTGARIAPSATGRYAGIVEVFRTDFSQSADRDYDGWPDDWTRRHGPGFPLFNKIAICGQSPPGGGRSLQIELNGGGAVADSPPVPLSPGCDYLVEAYVKTEGLAHDRVFLSFEVVGEEGKALQGFEGEKIPGSPQWTRLRLGPVSPDADSIRGPNGTVGRIANPSYKRPVLLGPLSAGVIGLHVEPTARSDLKARVWFGNIWLGRLPRITLEADARTRIYTDSKRIAVTCNVSGLTQSGAKASLELTDARGAVLSRISPSLAGEVQWRPPVPGPGFYRVRAAVEGYPAELVRREIDLAVFEPRRAPDRSEFGWSLSCGEQRLSLEALGDWLVPAGVRWVKYPIWLDASAPDGQTRQLAAFLDRMSSCGITVVGTLDQPPRSVLSRFDPGRVPCIAEVFSEARDAWYPSLERTMLAAAAQVRWWQLGRDGDASFVGYQGLEAKIAQVKREMDRVGYLAHVGMSWDRRHPLPSLPAGKTPWRFVNLSADPPLSAAELAASLPATRRGEVARWVTLQPLSRRGHTPEDRAKDLVERILAAKVRGAEGIFLSDPFDADHGLINGDGTPGELFLPWRTAALVLGGAQPLESMTLPGGSTSYVFVRDRDAAMVAWNRRPVQETLYLGEDVRHVDPWGHDQQPVKTDAGHRLRVGPLPTFVTGMDKAVALWRHGLVLAADRIASVLGERQMNRFEFRNTFQRAVEGHVVLSTPEKWSIRPARFSFRLKPGETLRQDFEITLPNDATSGAHRLRADFEVAADRAYRFSADRPIWIGVDQMRIDLTTHLNQRGEMEVRQRTVNESEKPIDLACQLFAPGRQRLMAQVVGLGRGQDLKVYRLTRGRELVGKILWLQAQETNGPQVLNCRITAEP